VRQALRIPRHTYTEVPLVLLPNKPNQISGGGEGVPTGGTQGRGHCQVCTHTIHSIHSITVSQHPNQLSIQIHHIITSSTSSQHPQHHSIHIITASKSAQHPNHHIITSSHHPHHHSITSSHHHSIHIITSSQQHSIHITRLHRREKRIPHVGRVILQAEFAKQRGSGLCHDRGETGTD
jgi:hypothetical protein